MENNFIELLTKAASVSHAIETRVLTKADKSLLAGVITLPLDLSRYGFNTNDSFIRISYNGELGIFVLSFGYFGKSSSMPINTLCAFKYFPTDCRFNSVRKRLVKNFKVHNRAYIDTLSFQECKDIIDYLNENNLLATYDHLVLSNDFTTDFFNNIIKES